MDMCPDMRCSPAKTTAAILLILINDFVLKNGSTNYFGMLHDTV